MTRYMYAATTESGRVVLVRFPAPVDEWVHVGLGRYERVVRAERVEPASQTVTEPLPDSMPLDLFQLTDSGNVLPVRETPEENPEPERMNPNV